jgi:hypothetical protein
VSALLLSGRQVTSEGNAPGGFGSRVFTDFYSHAFNFLPAQGFVRRAVNGSKRLRTYVHQSAIARGIVVCGTSKPLLRSKSNVPDVGRAYGNDLYVLATPIRFPQRWPIEQNLNIGRDFLRAILIQDSRWSKVIKFSAGRRPGVPRSSTVCGQGETL